MEKNTHPDSSVGNRNFRAEDYENQSELAQGLAETHEQVSDAYTSGTSDGVQTLSRDGSTRKLAKDPETPGSSVDHE